jgi:hypothetical protein
MLKVLRHVLGLCDHEWETVAQKKVDIHLFNPDFPWYVKLVFVFQCKKCKKIKAQKIRY